MSRGLRRGTGSYKQAVDILFVLKNGMGYCKGNTIMSQKANNFSKSIYKGLLSGLIFVLGISLLPFASAVGGGHVARADLGPTPDPTPTPTPDPTPGPDPSPGPGPGPAPCPSPSPAPCDPSPGPGPSPDPGPGPGK